MGGIRLTHLSSKYLLCIAQDAPRLGTNIQLKVLDIGPQSMCMMEMCINNMLQKFISCKSTLNLKVSLLVKHNLKIPCENLNIFLKSLFIFFPFAAQLNVWWQSDPEKYCKQKEDKGEKVKMVFVLLF